MIKEVIEKTAVSDFAAPSTNLSLPAKSLESTDQHADNRESTDRKSLASLNQVPEVHELSLYVSWIQLVAALMTVFTTMVHSAHATLRRMFASPIWMAILQFLTKISRMVVAGSGIVIVIAILFAATGANALQTSALTARTIQLGDNSAFQMNHAQMMTVNDFKHVSGENMFDEESKIMDVCDVTDLKSVLGFDSCSGGNVFNTTKLFTSFDKSRPNIKVRSANGIVTRAVATGTVEFYLVYKGRQQHIVLKHAVFVPGLCRNLLSTGRLFIENNMSVYMSSTRSFLSFPSGFKMPIQWTKKNGTTAYLDSEHVKPVGKPPSVIPSFVLDVCHEKSAVKDASKWKLWTNKMGGISPKVLAHLSENAADCNCPSDIPAGYENLKWSRAAVSAKMTAAPSPAQDKDETLSFRQKVAVDFMILKNYASHAGHKAIFTIVDYGTGSTPGLSRVKIVPMRPLFSAAG